METGAWTGQAFIQYDVSEVPPQNIETKSPLLSKGLQGGSYEGGVADGKFHGGGRLTDTLGRVQEGVWVHGRFDG